MKQKSDVNFLAYLLRLMLSVRGGCLLDKSDLSWEHYMIFWQKHMIFWEFSSCALSQSFHANPMDCVGNCVWTMASKVREGSAKLVFGECVVW